MSAPQHRYAVLALSAALLSFAIDRGLKRLALAGVTLGPPNGWARFELFPNPDIALSIVFPRLLGLVLIPIVMVIFMALAWRAFGRGSISQAALLVAIVIAAMSNYLDRLSLGYVVDYASFGQWFPVFNLSDVVVICGLILLAASGRRFKTVAE